MRNTSCATTLFICSLLVSIGTTLPTSVLAGSPLVNPGVTFAMASPSDSGNDQPKHKVTVPQLPECDPSADIPTLKLGEAMKLDHLGPVIINVDGTTKTIDNWDVLTEHEKEVAWRRISKRNAQRREALLKKMQAGEEEK